jgi:flagellar biosynthesis protein FliQ
MLKIMARVLIVLLAVGLIVGVTYAISQNESFSLPGGGGGQFGEHITQV